MGNDLHKKARRVARSDRRRAFGRPVRACARTLALLVVLAVEEARDIQALRAFFGARCLFAATGKAGHTLEQRATGRDARRREARQEEAAARPAMRRAKRQQGR